MTRPHPHQHGLIQDWPPPAPPAQPMTGWAGPAQDWPPTPSTPPAQPVASWRGPSQDWIPAPPPVVGGPVTGQAYPAAHADPAGGYGDVEAPTTVRGETTPTEPAAAEPVEPVAAVHLRRQAVERMTRMNLLHARHAWEQRRSDPVAPHALGLLFAQPDERPVYAGRWRLLAGWRMWVDGPDARNLADRLFQYHRELAKTLPTTSTVDIRSLATNVDKEMRPDAVYVGLAASSLDTVTGTWADLLSTGMVATLRNPAAAAAGTPELVAAESDTYVPGSVHILLADATIITVARRGMCEFDQQVIWSTRALGPHQDSPYPWTHITGEQAHDEHGPVLTFMSRLHDLFTQLDQARLVAATAPPTVRRPKGIA